MNPRKNARKGNFIVIVALALFALLAFGALAVDISYVRMAQGQAQDVADASSQAAVMVLRKTGDVALAADAAEQIVALNWIAGKQGTLEDISFGVWDDSTEPGSFYETEINPNSAMVTVGRVNSNSVATHLGSMFGFDSMDVVASATSATRSLQVMVVVDITNSWSQTDMGNARNAVVAFWDVLAESHSDRDEVGMVVFNYNRAWEYTPFTKISDDTGQIRADWSVLNEASYPGVDSDPTDGTDCYTTSTWLSTSDFSVPAPDGGGCYPEMPRRYNDEGGTDHSVGMEFAQILFAENPQPTSYRAVVLLTDGYPNQTYPPSMRAADGYVESRWREYEGTCPHTTTPIIEATQEVFTEMYADERIHGWVISFVADQAFLHDWPQGHGYFACTNVSSALIDIFEDVALSMPVAIVQ